MTKILLVEDDAAMAALVESGLRDEGYEITVVGNGIDALIAAANDDFAAAAIDVMLPEMTGFEICRHLRNHGSTLPILLLTARDAVEDRVFGLDSGADDYLTKPFAFVELSARIRALVRREAASAKPILRVGTMQLDTATVRATIDGRTVPLSAKEFSLLRMLAAHRGTILSRSDILTEVWGTTHHIDPTIVDQYVRYLRKKLEPIDTGFTVGTVRGVGYSLTEDGEV
ncbi:MAG: DNA-binding response regulator [Microbacteriaceae bacterium]|nr:DNA-binding response regulator [Microbacteriaceae bacterium]